MHKLVTSQQLLHITTPILAFDTPDVRKLRSLVLSIAAVTLEHQVWLLLDGHLLNWGILTKTHPIGWDAAVDTED